MKFGFIGFGEVSYTLSRILLSKGFEVLTSLEGRSNKTHELAKSLDLTILDSFEEVAQESDVLISANSPQSALAVGLKYGSLTDGIFLDFNNISPITAMQIENYIGDDHFIDSAIMGKIKSNEINIYLSGPRAEEFVSDFKKFINEPESNEDSSLSLDDNSSDGVGASIDDDYDKVKINVKIVSDVIGDVSRLKILRSSYTKGVSVLLIETFETAEKLGLADDLWDILDLTENGDFETSAKSRISSSYRASKRKYEELLEVLEFLDGVDKKRNSKLMALATKDKFEYLKNREN